MSRADRRRLKRLKHLDKIEKDMPEVKYIPSIQKEFLNWMEALSSYHKKMIYEFTEARANELAY